MDSSNRYVWVVALIVMFVSAMGLAQSPAISPSVWDQPNEVDGGFYATHPSSSQSAMPFRSRTPDSMLSLKKPVASATGVDWIQLTRSTLGFLVLEHGFRLLTEPQTRANLEHKSFFSGYVDSVTNLHGFGDGDPFYVNYVGHPMQGAVSGYIWQHNDRAYRDVEFGKNRRYWKSKLRSTAFSFFYSVQFEIGPLSEASVGNIQSDRPQVGFVDNIMTPTIGMAWTVAEDWIDRDVVQRLETRVSNPYLKVFIRSGLNPSRSLSNALSGKVPWHRDDRMGLFKRGEFYRRSTVVKQSEGEGQAVETHKGVAPFELTIEPSFQKFLGSSNSVSTCIGGQGDGAFRLAGQWQMVLEVGGCKMLNMPSYFTGDMLTYMVGPRWVHQLSSRWTTHLQALAGGTKYSVEQVSPEREAQETALANSEHKLPRYREFTTVWDHNSFSVRAGGGVNVKLNNAFSMRVFNLNYTRAFNGVSNGLNHRNGLQLTGGVILSVGTW